MATKKKEITIEMFEKYTDPVSAKQLWNLLFVKNNVCFESTSLTDLLAIHGMGRQRAIIVMHVLCDLAGKKWF